MKGWKHFIALLPCVVTCWILLAQVWANNTQHVKACHNKAPKCMWHIAPNSVIICCIEMLQSFGEGLKLFQNSININSRMHAFLCAILSTQESWSPKVTCFHFESKSPNFYSKTCIETHKGKCLRWHLGLNGKQCSRFPVQNLFPCTCHKFNY